MMKAQNDEQSEKDLIISGSELDDLQEDIGSEDEENNYYSLGGEDHSALEEEHKFLNRDYTQVKRFFTSFKPLNLGITKKRR